jgi:hypothetical protein
MARIFQSDQPTLVYRVYLPQLARLAAISGYGLGGFRIKGAPLRGSPWQLSCKLGMCRGSIGKINQLLTDKVSNATVSPNHARERALFRDHVAAGNH